MRLRSKDVVVLWAVLGLAAGGCGKAKETDSGEKRGTSSPGASRGEGPAPARGEGPVPSRYRPRLMSVGPKAPAHAPPRKRLNCKQGCEKLGSLLRARDQQRSSPAPKPRRPELRKASTKRRAALVARCNRECAEAPLIARCLTAGDTVKDLRGCLSTPRPPPMTTPAVAETKRRCAAFLAGVKARSGCDKLTGLLSKVAEAYGRVSNRVEFTRADEGALRRCLDESVKVGKMQCKAHRGYKVATLKILAATFRN